MCRAGDLKRFFQAVAQGTEPGINPHAKVMQG